jgi:translation initiation factor 3 subunit E
LQAEAQRVMEVIENPDVIAAIRQDKLQNLKFLKENYGVINKISDFIFMCFI